MHSLLNIYLHFSQVRHFRLHRPPYHSGEKAREPRATSTGPHLLFCQAYTMDEFAARKCWDWKAKGTSPVLDGGNGAAGEL